MGELPQRGLVLMALAKEDAIDETVVPGGSVFVLSDAMAAGRDSRAFGPVVDSRLLGTVWWRYAPRDRVGPVPGATSGST